MRTFLVRVALAAGAPFIFLLVALQMLLIKAPQAIWIEWRVEAESLRRLWLAGYTP